MKRVSEWFDRHMKTRIALQLVLDAVPLMQMIGFGVCVFNIFTYPLELEWLIDIGIFGFLLCTLPLFILGIKLRGTANGEFACYPWCEKASSVLRLTGALAVLLAVALDIFIIIALIGR